MSGQGMPVVETAVQQQAPSPAGSSTAALVDAGVPQPAGNAYPTPIRTVRLPNCGEDYYPAQSLRLNQQGAVVVKFCIGANNKVDGPIEVVTSSGFPLIDEAAGKCIAAGSYRAGTVNGQPIRSCKELKVGFAPLEGR